MRKINTEYDVHKGNISDLRYVVKYLRPYVLSLFGVFIALIITSFSVLSLGMGLKYLVDQGFSAQDSEVLDQALLVLFGIIIVLAAATFCRFYLITKVGEKVVADIRRDVYHNLVNLSPSFFEANKIGKIMSRMTTDTTVLQVVIGSSLSIALRNSLLLVGGLSMMIVTSPKLAGYIAVMIPLIVLPILLLGKKVRELSRSSQNKVADLAVHIEETLTGIKTVQSYNRETVEYDSFSDKVGDALFAAIDRVKLRGILTAIVIVVAFGSVGAILWVGGKDVIAGDLSAGELSSFVFYSVLVASAFGAISEVIGDIQRAAGAADSLKDLLATKSDILESKTAKSLPLKTSKVTFKNVTFSYPSKPDISALFDLSFAVEPGETIALVGPSGAGKSTILQLLLRFYDPDEGKITIGNRDIRDLKLQDLREQFAYVPQEPMIFSASARDNIAYGKIGASEKEIIEAAKAARAYDFIKKLPKGLNTFLGEKGVRLSGGERQRITIARAILRNPRILLLDEATSALDAENEKLVQEALEKLMENRTTIVIAHRLSTVQMADRIIVINNGKIEAIDSHKKLVKKNDLYQRLAELQFAA